MLKLHKSDGGILDWTPTILNMPIPTCTFLWHFCYLRLCHGSVPGDFLLCTTISLSKGNTNKTISGNYRGITLSSVFGRLIDILILLRYSDVLGSCNLQFGFKAKRSTAMCSMVLKEVISYYVNNGSSVFCVFLDATTAFDRVQYCSLFDKLLTRNVDPLFWELWSTSTHGVYSHNFPVINGVKQGGILSPVLFCVYSDEMFLALRQTHVGCFMGSWSAASAASDQMREHWNSALAGQVFFFLVLHGSATSPVISARPLAPKS